MGFINWHKKKIETVKKWFGFSDYGLLWIAFFKGLIIGALIVYYLSSA